MVYVGAFRVYHPHSDLFMFLDVILPPLAVKGACRSRFGFRNTMVVGMTSNDCFVYYTAYVPWRVLECPKCQFVNYFLCKALQNKEFGHCLLPFAEC